MSFPCTRCGLCCKNIQHLELLSEYHLGDGLCKYYDETLKGCSIYEQRPLICRIDEGYEKLFSHLMTLNEFYKKNAEVCNNMQKERNFDIIFKVVLKNEC